MIYQRGDGMKARRAGMRTKKALCVAIQVCLGLVMSSAWSEEASASGAPALRGGLHAEDWAVVIVYGLAMLGIGIYYSRRNRTSEDYYLGGRTMRPVMVGLSLFASMISTISYLATPGEIIKHGPVFLCDILALPIIYFIVGYVIIPFITKLPVTSAYEILENRFGQIIRLLGCVLFLLIRFVWMGLVVYTSAKVVVTATGLNQD
jgi:solute:Na+ symporter, SSS family